MGYISSNSYNFAAAKQIASSTATIVYRLTSWKDNNFLLTDYLSKLPAEDQTKLLTL